MRNWADGYFTGSHYTYGYFDYLSPVQQRFALLLNGLDCPLADEPQHCELGFGQGVTINVHSACNPGAYTGTDFTADQAVFAANLARRAGNASLTIFDDSFAEFHARNDLPAFDSISLHGIWSWVSEANRQVLMDICRRRLKPGGVLYLSYNCLPGWANVQPLQHLMALHDEFGGPGRRAERRVDEALAFVDAVLASGPAYAHAAGEPLRVQRAGLGDDKAYLAHEYLNRNWTAPYFSQVAQTLAEIRLEFGATAQILRRLDALYLTVAQRKLLAGIDNPVLRAQVEDYCINARFRTDLFARGAVRLSPEAQRIRLFRQQVVACVPAHKIHFTVSTHLGTFEPLDDQYGPVREAILADGGSPKSIGDVVGYAQGRGLDEARALRALLTLMGTGQVYACQPEPDQKSVHERARRFNYAIAQMALEDDHLHVLASPVTGAGIGNIGRSERLFLLATFDSVQDPVGFAWQRMRAIDAGLIRDGQTLQGDEANLAYLQEQYEVFRRDMLPVLGALKIV